MTEVAKFLTVWEAIVYCDSNPSENLSITCEFGWYLVWDMEA